LAPLARRIAVASVCSLLAKGFHPQVPLTASSLPRKSSLRFEKTLCRDVGRVKQFGFCNRRFYV